MFLRDSAVFTAKRVMPRQKFFVPWTTLRRKDDITRFDGTY